MKKYIYTIILFIGIFVSQHTYAYEMSVKDFVSFLIEIEVITPDKLDAINSYLDLNEVVSNLEERIEELENKQTKKDILLINPVNQETDYIGVMSI